MSFKEEFTSLFMGVKDALKAYDAATAIEGLQALGKLCADQAVKDNGDTLFLKAQLENWSSRFSDMAKRVENYGAEDIVTRKVFGFEPPAPRKKGEASFDGLMDFDAGKSPSGNDEAKIVTESDAESDAAGGAKAPSFAGFIDEPSDDPSAASEQTEAQSDDAKAEAVDATPAENEAAQADEAPSAQSEESEDNDPEEEPAIVDNSPVVSTDSQMDPQTLDDFIGQAPIVKELKKRLAIARSKGVKHLDNVLLFGNPGLGKTTLMKLIAKELGVGFEMLDCSQFRRSQQSLKALQGFFNKIATNNVPVVIGMDEIHMLSNDLQSSLLTLLNDRVWISPPDVNGNVFRYPMPEFTFIGATTDDNDVLDTIKNRCLDLTFRLQEYKEDELRAIYRQKFAALGLTATEDAIAMCIPRSRGAIRYVNANVKGLDVALYNDEGQRVSTHVDLSVAENYFKEKGIDSKGLKEEDRKVLKIIAEDPSGAVGAETIATRLGYATNKYLSEYERYLVKIGLITIVSGRGRCLTEEGIKHLKEVEENK